jgi:hypothetical protein
MCIIAAKPAGVKMPTEETIRTMWSGNHDGAGLMYVENGRVQVEKGFMKLKDFLENLDQLASRLDLTSTPVVMHFRITTHGGTRPENTHPFPITDSVGALKKLKTSADVAVAHNGIINSVTPRKGISDTMEYIATQLAPLKRALPRFYESKDAMLLVKNAIQSRMAFLTSAGKIYTVGDFIDESGILYSNTSYKAPLYSFRDIDWKYYGNDLDDTYGEYDPKPAKSTSVKLEPDKAIYVNWLYDVGYIVTKHGTLLEGDDYLVDDEGKVWVYDFQYDLATRVDGARAYSNMGAPYRFNEDAADVVYALEGIVTDA